jgi:CPA1 family monovalent cation:H+ antiporter
VQTADLVLALLVAVAALVSIARRLGIPYPIFLVIAGLALGLIPGIPRFEVEPDVIFLLVLPPLLYVAAFETPRRSFKAQRGSIASLAVGLVIASAAAVAVVGHELIPGLSWAAAFALGAIVAPPDAIAATAVATRFAVPRTLIALLEGESLLNDATALTLYRMALAAAAAGTFSPVTAATTFAFAAVGGAAIGLAVAWVIAWIRTRLTDTPVEITVSLLTGYAAFLPAERVGASGVIAAVVAGLYLGSLRSRMMAADVRLTGRAVWEMFTFLLTGFVFIVTGLEVPLFLGRLEPTEVVRLVGIGGAITLVLILVRAGWMFGGTYGEALIRREAGGARPAHALVLSWAGMRGVVSLAAALALPVDLPGRSALVVVTLTVIVLTLVGQGLTLGAVIRRVRLGTGQDVQDEELLARRELVDAASRRIDQLYDVWPGHRELLDHLRGQYAHRSEHVERDGSSAEADRELIEHREIRRNVIESEREALLRLRADGTIDDDVLRRLERDLDLEEQRMEA